MRPRRYDPLIIPALLMLVLSGLGGMIAWPPPGLADTYVTLIRWSGIDGPQGGLIRVVVGSIGFSAWILDVRALKWLSYALAIMTCYFIATALWDAGQGFAGGAWLAPYLIGLLAMSRV